MCNALSRAVRAAGRLRAAGVFAAADSGKGAKGQKHIAPDSAHGAEATHPWPPHPGPATFTQTSQPVHWRQPRSACITRCSSGPCFRLKVTADHVSTQIPGAVARTQLHQTLTTPIHLLPCAQPWPWKHQAWGMLSAALPEGAQPLTELGAFQVQSLPPSHLLAQTSQGPPCMLSG